MEAFVKIVKGEVMYKHGKAVRYEENDYGYTEYDAHDRVVFYYTKHNKYWCLKFYDDVVEGRPVNVTAYHVVHKYWTEYNNLP